MSLGAMTPSLIAGSSILGGASQLFGASSAADAAKQAAEEQTKLAGQNYDLQQQYTDYLKSVLGDTQESDQALLDESKDYITTAYNNINSIISNIPGVSDLYPEAEKLSQQDFDFRTLLKRQNLDFTLGEPSATSKLRSAQDLNARLANLDESAFTGPFNKIISSSLLGLKAQTVGEPAGSFSNLSAKNLNAFSQQGLSNYLAINDFFSKNGTVDPISPLTTSFQLEGVAQDLAKLNINNEQWQAGALTGVNQLGIQTNQSLFGDASQVTGLESSATNQYYNTLAQLSGSSALASAQQANSIPLALGSITQGLSSSYGLSTQQQSLANQNLYYQTLLSRLGNQFAPTQTFSSPTSYNYTPSGGYSAMGFTNPSVQSGGVGTSQLDNSLFPDNSLNEILNSPYYNTYLSNYATNQSSNALLGLPQYLGFSF